jgi:TnsA-like endonuclease N terminal
MVARVIPKNSRNVTGRLASRKHRCLIGFESTLEKDCYLLLEFDPQVERFEEQPVIITYDDATGKRHRYTPDGLIRYRRDGSGGRPDALGEIKYRHDLREHWLEYKPRFTAASRDAQQRGWRFRLVTAWDVRTPQLNHARFLLRYRHQPVDAQDVRHVLRTLRALGITQPKTLMQACSGARDRQARLIPVLWHLVAHGRVGSDLGKPLSMWSAIWPMA